MKVATRQENFEDRKKYPRLKISLPINVYYQKKNYVDACVHDIF